MPHVVIEGPVRIPDYESRFEPILYREGTRVIKVQRFFREKGGNAALLEAVAVEAGHQQKFLIQLTRNPEGLTVRLEPLTDPEKTTAVKMTLALVARQIVDRIPGTRYGRNNLSEYLIR